MTLSETQLLGTLQCHTKPQARHSVEVDGLGEIKEVSVSRWSKLDQEVYGLGEQSSSDARRLWVAENGEASLGASEQQIARRRGRLVLKGVDDRKICIDSGLALPIYASQLVCDEF